MPQLDPSPWFATLIFSWLVFLTLVVPNTMNFLFPNDQTPQGAQTSKTEIWTWAW